jgi:putative ABC transport system permease protein
MANYLKSDYRYSFTGWRWLSEEWWLLFLSLGIGFIAAIIPAIQASNTDINKTLSRS